MSRLNYLNHVPLSRYTTFKIGGPAKMLIEVGTPDDVVAAAQIAIGLHLPWRVIGHGSNILVADEGVDGAMIIFKNETQPRIEENGDVIVSGGYSLDRLVDFMSQRGLGGMEKLAGIPGTVGGAISGNAGAYGATTGERVKRTSLLGKDGHVRVAPSSELKFFYRHSSIKENGETVLEAVFTTIPADKNLIRNEVEEHLSDRRTKHPDYRSVPTAGSYFKNPNKMGGGAMPAGRLLEEAGCKELRVGGAHLWHKHANIIVTDGNASSKDVIELARQMADRVEKKFGIKLEPEVIYLK